MVIFVISCLFYILWEYFVPISEFVYKVVCIIVELWITGCEIFGPIFSVAVGTIVSFIVFYKRGMRSGDGGTLGVKEFTPLTKEEDPVNVYRAAGYNATRVALVSDDVLEKLKAHIASTNAERVANTLRHEVKKMYLSSSGIPEEVVEDSITHFLNGLQRRELLDKLQPKSNQLSWE